ncbi:MAG: dockerin type I repeat-containing protein [Candidatus Hydrogenedentes bacterium]|nr:dockerin type I repeat-containing protein [Candidatus Hydrogenedentota bacterium]
MERTGRIRILWLLLTVGYLVSFCLSTSSNFNSDLNSDGKVDVCDLSVLQSIILGKLVGVDFGDLNSDGSLDVSDFQVLLNEIGKKPPKKSEHRSFQPVNVTICTHKSLDRKEIKPNSSSQILLERIDSGYSPETCFLNFSLSFFPKSKFYIELGLMINAPPAVLVSLG